MHKYEIRVLMEDDSVVIFHATAQTEHAARRIALARYPDAVALGIEPAYTAQMPKVAMVGN